ncbi:MAG: gephyrin-like molybdotransferase Glp [Salaquimonas sp.]
MADLDNILHRGLIPAPLALKLVLDGAKPAETETVPLEDAAGRILANDLHSKRTQPPFPASAMDGYAVRFEDLQEPGTTLNMIGEAAAGHPFDGKISNNECVRIFTGAPVPEGADTIIIQENVTAEGNNITINELAPMGKFVRSAGLDFLEGQCLLTAGSLMDPQSLSLCASMDHPKVTVYAKPKVAVLATGDELVLPGETTKSGQIIASNTFGIAAISRDAGGDVINLGIARDTLVELISRIGTALDNGADLIVTSGGASVGDHDLVKPAMEHFGFTFSFVKIAMRPGKPVLFGRALIDGKERRFLGLAGNPVSSLVSSHIYLKPLIRMLGGYSANTVKPINAVLGVDLAANDEREDYLRGTAKRGVDGELVVRPFERQDSSMLATLSKADCLIIRPIAAPAAKTGDITQVIMLRDV